MHKFIVFLFAVASGMTASGIIASLYRMVAGEPKTWLGRCLHYAVMIVAGPVVLIGNSIGSFRDKQCSKAACALAIALGTYWSFATGFVILVLVVALRGA